MWVDRSGNEIESVLYADDAYLYSSVYSGCNHDLIYFALYKFKEDGTYTELGYFPAEKVSDTAVRLPLTDFGIDQFDIGEYFFSIVYTDIGVEEEASSSLEITQSI